MSNENPEGNLGKEGDLPSATGLSPEQLKANRELMMARFDQRFGFDNAGYTNPVIQHSPQDPAAHGS